MPAKPTLPCPHCGGETHLSYLGEFADTFACEPCRLAGRRHLCYRTPSGQVFKTLGPAEKQGRREWQRIGRPHKMP